MVLVKHRSSYDSSFEVNDSSKSTLPYGNGLIKKSAPADLLHIPAFFESQGRKNKNRTHGSCLPILVKGTVLVVLCYYIFSLYDTLTERDAVLRDLRREFDSVEDALAENDANIDSTRSRMKSIQSQFGKLLPPSIINNMVERAISNNDVIYEKVVERQGAMVNRINELQNNIAELNRWEAVEHFGIGPHRVQFNIRVNDNLFSFIAELAGLEHMPHSVHYFLQMIKEKVWDNTVFGHHSKHILFAQLIDADGNEKSNILKEKDLPQSLSFPEYTDKYPHHKYTLGFSGRPGGPGFYINTDDNAQTHGPGGQKEHALHEEADPCFGTVVEGHDVINWMQAKTDKAMSDGNMKTYTMIDSVRLL